jgi:uncharacterized protein YdbL (DUF1318 family)
MDQNIENFNSPNEEEIVNPINNEPNQYGLPADPIEVEPKDEDADDSELLKQRNQELYEQLKKAKGFVRDKDGKWVKKEIHEVPKETRVLDDVSRTELYSLVKANVPEEDTQEVVIYAKSRGMTITDALKTPEVKAILKVRQEYRTTANASNVGSSRRGVSKITDEALIENASKGNLPTDDEAIIRLAKLHIGIKPN